MYLQYVENKFSGGIGEYWQEFFELNKQVTNEYGLSELQKQGYFHNNLRKDAQP